MSLFCTEVLANRKGIFLMLKQLAMRFHYALERVVGLPKWFLIKLKLLKTICLPMYGLNLWSTRKNAKGALKQLEVSYHLGLKRISGYPKYFSSHFVC